MANLAKIIVELRQERQQIEEVIGSIEQLELGIHRKGGRPTKRFSEITPRRRGRPLGSKNKSKLAPGVVSASAEPYFETER